MSLAHVERLLEERKHVSSVDDPEHGLEQRALGIHQLRMALDIVLRQEVSSAGTLQASAHSLRTDHALDRVQRG